jgi:hypothetical protein
MATVCNIGYLAASLASSNWMDVASYYALDMKYPPKRSGVESLVPSR